MNKCPKCGHYTFEYVVSRHRNECHCHTWTKPTCNCTYVEETEIIVERKVEEWAMSPHLAVQVGTVEVPWAVGTKIRVTLKVAI